MLAYVERSDGSRGYMQAFFLRLGVAHSGRDMLASYRENIGKAHNY